jgi:hypothetical protein
LYPVRPGSDAYSMTVLEEERKMTSGLSIGDRYITPEYLAPLPTSVRTKKLTLILLKFIIPKCVQKLTISFLSALDRARNKSVSHFMKKDKIRQCFKFKSPVLRSRIILFCAIPTPFSILQLCSSKLKNVN